MDINEISQLLPHRYPFLLVDRVLECMPGESLVGIKNVTINEPFFAGHFPGYPVMPGVLIVEALAQACGLLAFKSSERRPNAIFYLVGVENARFKRPVQPGDQLRLRSQLKRTIRGVWMFDAQATVDGQLVAECEIRCTMRDVER
jgi:3-hydroxyacyl-[acyl-carrier-protein] dehydratase